MVFFRVATDMARELSEKTGEWAETDMNKRKRRLDDNNDEQKENDAPMVSCQRRYCGGA